MDHGAVIDEVLDRAVGADPRGRGRRARQPLGAAPLRTVGEDHRPPPTVRGPTWWPQAARFGGSYWARRWRRFNRSWVSSTDMNTISADSHATWVRTRRKIVVSMPSGDEAERSAVGMPGCPSFGATAGGCPISGSWGGTAPGIASEGGRPEPGTLSGSALALPGIPGAATEAEVETLMVLDVLRVVARSALIAAVTFTAPLPWEAGMVTTLATVLVDDPRLPSEPGLSTLALEADIRRTVCFAVAFRARTRTVAITEPPGPAVADDSDMEIVRDGAGEVVPPPPLDGGELTGGDELPGGGAVVGVGVGESVVGVGVGESDAAGSVGLVLGSVPDVEPVSAASAVSGTVAPPSASTLSTPNVRATGFALEPNSTASTSEPPRGPCEHTCRPCEHETPH